MLSILLALHLVATAPDGVNSFSFDAGPLSSYSWTWNDTSGQYEGSALTPIGPGSANDGTWYVFDSVGWISLDLPTDHAPNYSDGAWDQIWSGTNASTGMQAGSPSGWTADTTFSGYAPWSGTGYGPTFGFADGGWHDGYTAGATWNGSAWVPAGGGGGGGGGVSLPDLGVDLVGIINVYGTEIAGFLGLLLLASAVLIGIWFVWKKFRAVAGGPVYEGHPDDFDEYDADGNYNEWEGGKKVRVNGKWVGD